MSDPVQEQIPKTQSALGAPSRPPGISLRVPQDQPPDDSSPSVLLPDPVLVRDLAGALQLRPFKVVADLLELRLFKSPDDAISFETASVIARKHGCRAERPPPGVLVL